MTEAKQGCAPTAAGPIAGGTGAGRGRGDEATASNGTEVRGGTTMQARVGHPAPDFEATAYHQGGFRNVKLSEYAGRWVVLCFYPGDFTFV